MERVGEIPWTIILNRIPEDVRLECDHNSDIYNLDYFIENVVCVPPLGYQIRFDPAYRRAVNAICIRPSYPKMPKVPEEPDKYRRRARLIFDDVRPINLYSIDDAIILFDAFNKLQKALYDGENVYYNYEKSILKFARVGYFPRSPNRPKFEPFASQFTSDQIAGLVTKIEGLCEEIRKFPAARSFIDGLLNNMIDPELIRTVRASKASGVVEMLKEHRETLKGVIEDQRVKMDNICVDVNELLNKTIRPTLKLMRDWESGIEKFNRQCQFYEDILPPVLETVKFFYNSGLY